MTEKCAASFGNCFGLSSMRRKTSSSSSRNRMPKPVSWFSYHKAGCLDVQVRLPLEDEPPCYPSGQRSRNLDSISVRTSAHGRPAVGSARYDSSRSRMILRCQAEIGTCSGVAAMRSQRDCTKSIGSSTDNSSNPGGGEGIGLDI